jgi:hypothetical protein
VQKGGLHFRERFTLKPSTPLVAIDSTKISLVNKDSIAVPFTYKYYDYKQELVFDFKKEEEEKYQVILMPGALTDFYDKQSDTLIYKLSTRSYSDYGNLTINLTNVKRWPVMVELTDTKGKLYASAVSEGQTALYFEAVEPNKYLVRLIYDDNKNGEWDTGDYMKKLQPEEVIYLPKETDPNIAKEVDVRDNWEVSEDFNAGR